jgi:hypothetical protein
VLKVPKELKGQEDLREHRERLVLVGLKVLKVTEDLKETKDCKVPKVPKVLKEVEVHKELKVL